MSEKQYRVLIFGAGVTGSIYAVKSINAGIDVTIFARADRLRALQENGLQYCEKGTVKSVSQVSSVHLKMTIYTILSLSRSAMTNLNRLYRR